MLKRGKGCSWCEWWVSEWWVSLSIRHEGIFSFHFISFHFISHRVKNRIIHDDDDGGNPIFRLFLYHITSITINQSINLCQSVCLFCFWSKPIRFSFPLLFSSLRARIARLSADPHPHSRPPRHHRHRRRQYDHQYHLIRKIKIKKPSMKVISVFCSSQETNPFGWGWKGREEGRQEGRKRKTKIIFVGWWWRGINNSWEGDEN